MKKLVLLTMFFSSIFHGMENHSSDNSLVIFAIPGQNGCGSESYYVQNLFENEQINIIKVPTPNTLPTIDLGQKSCMIHLRKTLTNHTEKAIIHATSQGTATAINYLAHEDKGKQIKGLILEAVLSSGNSTILHTVKNGPRINPYIKKIACLPLSYYWFPYCVKALFPFYWPAGKQAIKSIDQIPNDIPIIIVHSKDDHQISYNDSCALYYRLRSQGNNNVYFITKESSRHLQILQSENDKIVIQTILQKHGLLHNIQQQEIDLKSYQPDYMQFKKYYDDLIFKERNHEQIAYAAVTGLCFALMRFCGIL